MEFCPKCGSVLVQKRKNDGCARCDYAAKSRTKIKTSERMGIKKEVAVVKDKDLEIYPVIDLEKACEKCGNKLRATDQDEIGELMTEKAIASGAEVKLVSTDTREGQQFKELGGVGAFLRYKVEKLD